MSPSQQSSSSCKQFKRSPLKNEIMQNVVKEKHANGLQLIHDCKTRWSSLLIMLERIIEIQIPVQKTLLDLNSDVNEINKVIYSSETEIDDTEMLPVAMKLQLAIDASLKTSQEIHHLMTIYCLH